MIFLAGKKASGKDTIANAAVMLGSIAEPSTHFHIIHPAKIWVMKTFQVQEHHYETFRSKHRNYIQQRASEVLKLDPKVLLRIIDEIPNNQRRGCIVVGIRFLHERDYARAQGIPAVLIETPIIVRKHRLADRGESFVDDDPFERELVSDYWDETLDGTKDVQHNAMRVLQLMLRVD